MRANKTQHTTKSTLSDGRSQVKECWRTPKGPACDTSPNLTKAPTSTLATRRDSNSAAYVSRQSCKCKQTRPNTQPRAPRVMVVVRSKNANKGQRTHVGLEPTRTTGYNTTGQALVGILWAAPAPPVPRGTRFSRPRGPARPRGTLKKLKNRARSQAET